MCRGERKSENLVKNQLKTNRRKERECEEEDRGGRNIACCWRKEKEEKSCVHCFSALCVCICQVRRMAAMSPPVDRTHKHITSLALLPPPPALYSSRAVFRSSTTLGDDSFPLFSPLYSNSLIQPLSFRRRCRCRSSSSSHDVAEK